MAKIHIKGRMLQYLEEKQPLWDYQISDRVMEEYGLSGDYWRGTVRVLLADLFSCGLIESVEEDVDEGLYFGEGKVLFSYVLSQFGRERMVDTGLSRL